MKRLITIFCLCLLAQTNIRAQNYIRNGGFELGLNTFWKHSIANGAEATFKIRQDSYVMEGTVG